jgi:hypothetical protein
MAIPMNECARTCKEICSPVEIALVKEKEAMLQYDALRSDCPYPEVKLVMNELILLKEKSIRLLEDSRIRLKEKFSVLGQIQETYDGW